MSTNALLSNKRINTLEVFAKTYEDAIQDVKEQSKIAQCAMYSCFHDQSDSCDERHRMCRESESNRMLVCSVLCFFVILNLIQNLDSPC